MNCSVAKNKEQKFMAVVVVVDKEGKRDKKVMTIESTTNQPTTEAPITIPTPKQIQRAFAH